MALRIALQQVDAFCQQQGVSLSDVGADPVKNIFYAVDRLAASDSVKDNFLGQENDIERLYKAIMPDPVIPELAPRCQVVQEVAKALRALIERKLKNLIRFNASRYDFLERFEKMVDEYNKGSVSIEEF